jgi:acetoin utilization protein AcuB
LVVASSGGERTFILRYRQVKKALSRETEAGMLVKEWMSKDPITINDDTSMMKAIHLMKQNRIRRLPVLHGGRLVGIVSDRDLKEASPSKATTLDVHELYYLLSELQVKDIMTRDPVTVSPENTVEHAAQLMLENTISGLPVVDDRGNVVGILTQSDVFRAFMHITGILQGGVQFALRLEDRPGLIKEVVDLLREKGARFVSLLTSYTSAEEGYRDVYIRVKNLSPEGVESAKKELAARHEVLYVREEKD